MLYEVATTTDAVGFVDVYNKVHASPIWFAVAVAIILPFLIIAVGFIIGNLGEALALVASLFVDPWLVYAIINYLFFPGVMLHELSHALLAVLTGAKVTEVALFKKEGKSLGHVNFKNRGNKLLVTLQYIFISSAPMFCGAIITYACWYGVFHIGTLWLRILLGYIGTAMFFHMTMSPQDIKVYVKGIPLFMCIVFVITLILRVSGVV